MRLLSTDELLTADVPKLREHFDSLEPDAEAYTARMKTEGIQGMLDELTTKYARLAGGMQSFARILLYRVDLAYREMSRISLETPERKTPICCNREMSRIAVDLAYRVYECMACERLVVMVGPIKKSYIRVPNEE